MVYYGVYSDFFGDVTDDGIQFYQWECGAEVNSGVYSEYFGMLKSQLKSFFYIHMFSECSNNTLNLSMIILMETKF